jgi:hypothetical protein
MKSSTAALSLAALLAAPAVFGQTPGRGAGRPVTTSAAPSGNGAAGAIVKTDNDVLPANATIPEPLRPEQMKAAEIALPDDPIEPYLLTREAGPFMVIAKSFRGPESARYALALALELRREYGLPAYVLRSKDFPGHSNIRNVPPTAPPGVNKPRLSDPERVRTYDEAVVMVGNEKTQKGASNLLHRVKKINPKCLKGVPSFWGHREGLRQALMTTNPFVPAQDLFPGKPPIDPIVKQMNQGPRSLFKCPGRYSLQVVEFSGRSSFNVNALQVIDQKSLERSLRDSPLKTAHEDAERLANALAKAPEIKQLGQPVYVYHDRYASRVMIGSFNTPNDPTAVQVHDNLLKLAVSIMDTTKRKRGIDKMIAPAPYLTDLEPIKPDAATPVDFSRR